LEVQNELNNEWREFLESELKDLLDEKHVNEFLQIFKNWDIPMTKKYFFYDKFEDICFQTL